MARGPLDANRSARILAGAINGEQGYAYDGVTDSTGEVLDGFNTGLGFGSPGVADIRKMIREDAQGQAIDFGLTLPIRRNSFDIEGAKDGGDEAKFARNVLLDPAAEGGMTTPMQTVIAQMTTAIAYSKACFEKVFETKQTDARFLPRSGYKKIAFRPPQTCTIKLDRNGSFDGFFQEITRNGQYEGKKYFAPERAFVYLHGHHLDPGQGVSAYRAAYSRYEHKQKVEALLFQHLSRIAGGIKWGKYTGVAQGDEAKAVAQSFFDRLRSVRGQGTIITGPEEDVDLLQMERGSEEFREVLMYLNSEMARSVLCQFLMLGTESNVGSWALSKDHSDFFIQALEAIMKEMEMAINNFVIAPLVTYNFPNNPKMPRFRFDSMAQSTRELAHKTWVEFTKSGDLAFNTSFASAMDEMARQAMGIPQEAVVIPEDGKDRPVAPKPPLETKGPDPEQSDMGPRNPRKSPGGKLPVGEQDRAPSGSLVKNTNQTARK